MKIDRETKVAEATARMELLGVQPEIVRQFRERGLLVASMPGVTLFADKEDLERIRQFEEEHGALVYMVLRNLTKLGLMDTFLFVGDCVEEWEQDRDDLNNDQALAYVYSYSRPENSEFGAVSIERTPTGKILRVW